MQDGDFMAQLVSIFKIILMRLYIILILSILYSATAFAEKLIVLDEEMQELLNLDLEELTTVSVASKKEETIDDAPGIITVVTADDIKRYGYRNLRDILDRQTHMQIVGSQLFPHDRVSLRGSTFTHTDNTVLPLLNGRPIRDASGVSNNQDLYNAFPVESIKQIEIIRGPGSILYGTNAFAGVINIITKDTPNKPSGDISVTYGSFDTKKTTFSGGGQWGDLKITGAINAFDEGGDDFDNITDQFGNTGKYKTGQDGLSAVLQAKFKGFTLNALATDTNMDHSRTFFQLPSDDIDTARQYIDVGYRYNITNDWDISANILYHQHDVLFTLNTTTPVNGLRSQNIFGEITTRAKISNKLAVLAGGSYNENDGLFKNDRFTYNTKTYSAYGQFDFWATDWIKLIGGVQYNKPEDTSGDFSPRAGAIFNFNDNWGGKVLWGEAFREPSPLDRFVRVPNVLSGDPSLEPETIETLDIQLLYNGKQGTISATYFHSFQKLISRVGTSPQVISNSGEVTYDGIELEGDLDIGHGFSFTGNLSYQTNDKNNGTENITYSPDWMIKTGMSYESNKGYQFSLFNSYFTASTLQNHQVTTVTNSNPDADGYNLLTANLIVNLGDLFKTSALRKTTFSLYGDNLLDEKIFFPSISATTVNSIPHHQGRGFYGTFSIDF
jgi:outer membrane receptor protein involved in Fe transport